MTLPEFELVRNRWGRPKRLLMDGKELPAVKATTVEDSVKDPTIIVVTFGASVVRMRTEDDE